MDRVAVFVDAGYLFAQGSVLLTGQKRPRKELVLNEATVVGALADFAYARTALPLLRVYWYDGTSVGPSPQHISLAHLPEMKVRLGFINSSGEQKGVDSLIVTEMITLARNRAMTDAVLVSGDEDLRVGVQQAQEFGVRVHLLGIEPSRGNQSRFLMQEADSCAEWSRTDIERILSHGPKLTHSTPDTAIAHAPGHRETAAHLAAAREVAASVSLELIPALILAFQSSSRLPAELDAVLLAKARSRIGRNLLPSEKRALREAFIQHCASREAANDSSTHPKP